MQPIRQPSRKYLESSARHRKPKQPIWRQYIQQGRDSASIIQQMLQNVKGKDGFERVLSKGKVIHIRRQEGVKLLLGRMKINCYP